MGMDVFIPEEYVIKRRLEKKAAASASASGKMSKSHSHRKNNESTHNRVSSSTTHPPNASYLSSGFSLVADNVVFTCLSA
ncbi:hypothetical protein HKD37_08G020729 [Glycine soja]